MQNQLTRKITVSLPQELVEFADQAATRTGASRSEVISRALADAKAQSERQMAAEGYRYYAGSSVEFAETTANAVSEAIAGYSVEGRDDDGSAW